MQVKLCENISKNELDGMKRMIGEAFVSNELFHEFGDINTRRELVLKYMDIYLDYVYELGALYATDDRNGAVGFISSKNAPVFAQIKMLARLILAIPFKTLKMSVSTRNTREKDMLICCLIQIWKDVGIKIC